MAKRRISRLWQRGTADMVSVGVGVILLGIVTAGTSAALVYGREAMIRQEHYKAAAYILRGYMEQVQGALQYVPNARSARGLAEETFGPEPLDRANERGSRVQRVSATIIKDPVEEVDDITNGTRQLGSPPDYYRLTMHARWTERDYAEDGDNLNTGMQREITFKTAVLVRAIL